MQQWFEYCPSTNKRNCPICKQKCLLKDPFRLYFQSSGNQIDSRKSDEIEEDPAILRGEVKRLEGKIHNLTLALEFQKKENVEISDTVILRNLLFCMRMVIIFGVFLFSVESTQRTIERGQSKKVGGYARNTSNTEFA